MRQLYETSANEDKLLNVLRSINRFSVRCLAVLMTMVILFGVFDVAVMLYNRLNQEPFLSVTIGDMVGVFGEFIAVLIAIEIFVNITVYLTEHVIHVQIAMATALMAIARKVIILDFKDLDPAYVWSTAAVVLAMSIGYWLVSLRDPDGNHQEHGLFTMNGGKTAKKQAEPASSSSDRETEPSSEN